MATCFSKDSEDAFGNLIGKLDAEISACKDLASKALAGNEYDALKMVLSAIEKMSRVKEELCEIYAQLGEARDTIKKALKPTGKSRGSGGRRNKEVPEIVANWLKERDISSNRLNSTEKSGRATGRRYFGRLSKGSRLARSEYRIPILQALVELGGKAPADVVLNRVKDIVRHKLTPADLEGKPSQPTEERWRNTANWCRSDMVREGLLRSDSPRGIWEITDKGRQYLKQHTE